MIIYLDFDGTVVEFAYPKIGAYNEDAFAVVKRLNLAGHRIVLNTYRANLEDGTLEESIQYLEKEGNIQLDGIERVKRNPLPWDWTEHMRTSEIYIDDQAFDIPWKLSAAGDHRIVDWSVVEQQLETHQILPSTEN